MIPGTGTFGWDFHGQTAPFHWTTAACYAVRGEGVVEDGVDRQNAFAELCRWTGTTPTPFARVTEPVSG